MQLTIFGASGMVGQLVVDRALRDHTVVAFVHSRNPFSGQEAIRVVQGDVGDASAVAQALHGTDAVISTVGGWGSVNVNVLTSAMRAIIPLMREQHIDRLVSLTGAGASWSGDPGGLRIRTNRLALRLMKSATLVDADAHLELLTASELDWTCVRAPGIRKAGVDGYRLSRHVPSLLVRVNGPAVARCLVDLAVQPAFSQEAPGIHSDAAGD